MLWTIAVILTVLWLLGLVSSYTMGGFIHILLVIAIIGSWTESVGSRVTSRGGGWPSNARVDGVGFGGRDQPRSIPSG